MAVAARVLAFGLVVAVLLGLVSAQIPSPCYPPFAGLQAVNDFTGFYWQGFPQNLSQAAPPTIIYSGLAACTAYLQQQSGVMVPGPEGLIGTAGYQTAQAGYANIQSLMVGLADYDLASVPLSLDCYNQFLALVCGTFLPDCGGNITDFLADYGSTFYLPTAVCVSECLNFYVANSGKCFNEISNAMYLLNYKDGSPTINITQAETLIAQIVPPCNYVFQSFVDPRSTQPEGFGPNGVSRVGQPFYPVSAQVWTYATVPPPNATNQVSIPCRTWTPVVMNESQFPCYYPLKRSSDVQKYGYCGLICPLPYYTHHSWQVLIRMTYGLGYIGWVGSLLLCVTMMFLPRYRHYPANIIVWMLFAAHISAFGWVFPSMYGWMKMACHDETHTASQGTHDKGCIFNGLNFLFGAVALPIFWCAVALNSWIAIYLKKDALFKSYRWQMEAITHVGAWFGPACSCITALAVNRIGFPGVLTFCVTTGNPSPRNGLPGYFTIDDVVYFGPVTLLLFIGSVAILMVLYEMRNVCCRSGQELFSPHQMRAAAGKNRWSKHIRLLAFLVVFMSVYAFIFAYKVWATVKSRGWAQAMSDWVGCAQIRPGCNNKCDETTPYYPCTPSPPDYTLISYGVTVAFSFYVSAQPVLLIALFGSNIDIINFWRERIRNIRESRSFFEGVTSAKSTGASRTSTATSKQITAPGDG